MPRPSARSARPSTGRYEREYTYRLDAPVEFVGAHVIAIASVGKLEPAPLPKTGRALGTALKGRRSVDYAAEGIHAADVYDGELLGPGMRFDGPAIIETKGGTVVVHPGNELVVDDYGNASRPSRSAAGRRGGDDRR